VLGNGLAQHQPALLLLPACWASLEPVLLLHRPRLLLLPGLCHPPKPLQLHQQLLRWV
jgi:hypothetical protein